MRARLTGRVLTHDRRHGTSQKTGKDYDFTEAQVVSAYGVATVTLPTPTALELRAADHFSSVDWVVEFSAYGGNISCNFINVFDEEIQAEVFARLAG